MTPSPHPQLSLASPDPLISEREQLRREMRARRRNVTHAEQAQVAAGLARIISRSRLLRPGRRIAVYLHHGREVDLSQVIALARRRRCVLYLPAITDHQRGLMEFVRFDPGTRMRRNRFGILEPEALGATRIAVRALDLILLPLVAVDARGWRLGSGAGFYDRRLKHLHSGCRWRRPRLVGVAYEFQRVTRLTPGSWDIPVDAVVTDKALYPAFSSVSCSPRTEAPA